ncbi:ABC transporter substrate-binding protein [Enterococcus massiliensis]|uniref:ABC transporter substrate-binding protein n=1 Tax=Enterococcus massiliensis TaxID=1640685 RepID=UPI00065E6529|nr:sugar ABC transporter substrate-binding protein [Enterococcus massiliensis]
MKHTTKRNLSVLFIGLVSALLLTGCGGGKSDSGKKDGDDKGKTKISMSVWGMPFESDLYTKTYIPEFEKENPDIEVEFNNFDKLRDKYITLNAANDLPDVMRAPGGDVQEYIHRGMYTPLDKYMEESDFDTADFPAEIWPAMKGEDGKTYAIPQDANAMVLYYDPASFKEAGLAEPDDNYTLDQMMKDAKTLTKKDKSGNVDKYGFVTYWDSDNFINFVLSMGGNLWDKDDKSKSAVDSPESIAALDYWKDLVVDFQLTPSSSDQKQMGPDAYFQSGKAAMFMSGTWMAPSIKKAAPKLDFKVTSFPKGEIKTDRSQSSSFGVSKDSKNPEAAWKLVQFLTAKEQLDVYWQDLWVAAPARLSSLNDDKAFKNIVGVKSAGVPGIDSEQEFTEKASAIKTIINNKWIDQTWVSPYMNFYHTEVTNAIESVLVDGAKPKKALTDAAKNINKSIEQSK